MTLGAAQRILSLLHNTFDRPFPLRLRAWDGTEAGPAGQPVLVLRDQRALRRVLWQPNELGLARAYMADELDLEGDIHLALEHLDELALRLQRENGLTFRQRLSALRELAPLGVVGRPPSAPPGEVHLQGRRHSVDRDRRAIGHHYDAGNEFFRLVLGPSMTYSCAYWTSLDSGYGLDDAQFDKLRLIDRKLSLGRGTRLLDVGCGWGALALYAAREYGAQVVGITLSRQQADFARKQVANLGLEGLVEIRLQDYREVDDGPYDAIASIGMAEHVGLSQYAHYASAMYELLSPGGRFLNQEIAVLHQYQPGTSAQRSKWLPRMSRSRRRTFINAYVFPDAELKPVDATIRALEAAGFEVRDVEALREHYARTLRAWVKNLDQQPDLAAGPALRQARLWRLYMAASALAFERGRIAVNQVLAVKPHADGRTDLPLTRNWLDVTS